MLSLLLLFLSNTLVLKRCFHNIVDPHYLWIPCLHTCTLAKMYWQPPNQHSQDFDVHLQICTKWWEIWFTQRACSQVRGNQVTLCPLVSVHTVNKCHSCSLFSALFLIFLCLVLVTLLFNMSPMCSATMLPGVPQGKRLWCAFTEKVFVFDKLLSDTRYSAIILSSMLIYQKYILNKVTLKRNTQRKRLCIDQLKKMWLRLAGT